MKANPPQRWSDLEWRDKVRLRVPDLAMLGVILIIIAAFAVGMWAR